MHTLQTTRFTDKTILVIDDEWRLAESLAALLRGAGHQVVPCGSGRDALRFLAERNYDLVITDLRMDEIDGFDIMRHLAEHHPRTAIIVITGHASTESAIEALHQRVADYIPKPFDFDFLRAAIDRVFIQQESEQMRRDLIRMLSHDIKVPLTGILGYAQLMVHENPEHRRDPAECAARIMANCHRVLSMLDNFLTNARDEEDSLEINPLPISPVDLIEEGISLLAWDFARKNIEIRRQYSEEPLLVEADEPLLGRAIGNLLSNAAKYTPANESVEVSCRREGENQIAISVANTGAPITDEDAARLFGRFRRGQSSRGIDGSGLGLHVVKLVAEAHKGRAICELDEGGVIRFVMQLPEKAE